MTYNVFGGTLNPAQPNPVDESNKAHQSAERIWAQLVSVQCTLHGCRLLMTPRSSRFDLIRAR